MGSRSAWLDSGQASCHLAPLPLAPGCGWIGPVPPVWVSTQSWLGVWKNNPLLWQLVASLGPFHPSFSSHEMDQLYLHLNGPGVPGEDRGQPTCLSEPPAHQGHKGKEFCFFVF